MDGPQWKQLAMKEPGKKLDFQVRVHVIEGREFQPRDANGMSDPVCFVKVKGEKQNTTTFKSTTICTWDHLMFFSFKVLPDEFFTEKINLTVFDANTVMRDVEIGSFEMDLAFVYEAPGHELYRKWIALIDTSGKFEGIQGYLKVSITVLGPGDTPPAHEEDEEEDEENDATDLQSMVLLPPSISTQHHNLGINVFRAENLPKMDTFGKCDGFVVCKFGSHTIKTEIIKKNLSPQWMERLQIPVTTPTMADIIQFQVRDWDAVGKDEVVSTVYLKWSEVSANGGTIDWKVPRWINLYGSPEEAGDNEQVRKMNCGYLEGSSWRGRVLVSVEAKSVATAQLTKHKINPVKEPNQSKYLARLDVFELAEIPGSGKLSVELSIGSFHIQSKKFKIENGYVSVYTSLDELVLSYPSERDQVPDIFINIYRHSKTGLTKAKRLGFVRLKATEVTSKPTSTWELLKTDIFGDTPDGGQIAGFIQFRLAFGKQEEFVGNRQPIGPPKLQKYQLRAHIYQGKDLPSADGDGFSDPFCIVRAGKATAKTQIVKGTTFPLWYESLTLDVEVSVGGLDIPEVHVNVYDWDRIGKNDYLGRFSLPLSSFGEAFPETPTWYPIYMNNKSITEGEILASFQLIPAEKSNFAVPKITPKFRDCTLEISAIGLRELLPYQLLEIRNPYVSFDVGGGERVKTKSSKVPSGSNPNLLEVLTVDVKIPENKIYAPPINIRVYDDRVIVKPLIATRSLPLEAFIPWEAVRPNISEDAPRVVDDIPGAKNIKEENPPQKEIQESQQELSESPETLFLSKEEEEMEHVKEDLISRLGERTIPEVQEKFLTGADTEEEELENKRPTVKHELEADFSEASFGVYKLYRAKKRKGVPFKYEVGQFKGKFRVWTKDSKPEPAQSLTELYKPTEYVVRVYAIEGYQLVPKDADGKNNPYLILDNRKTKIADVDTKKQGTSRPQFYKCYEIQTVFPDYTKVEISVMDYDKLTKDELIGYTKIDLENRFFNEEWQKMPLKPYEYRSLWTPSSSNPQGQLKLWIDIMTPQQAKETPPENIAPPKVMSYELRVIVWSTKNVVFKDAKMSDIFVTGYMEGQKPQTTDTHWRSEDGKGEFNWRMKFPVTWPCPVPRFKLAVWDKDILNPNDAIGEANLNMRPFFKKAYKKESVREVLEKQWISLTHPAADGVQGEVFVSFELLTEEEAARRPAGFGRKEPNDNPFLEPPKRPETSFNPFRLDKMLSKVIIGQNKGKIAMIAGGICACICLILILYLAIQFA